MAGALPQLAAQNLRTAHEVVAALEMFAHEEVFQNGAEHHALGQPEGHAGGHVFVEGEETELLAETAMVASLGFLDGGKVVLEALFVRERRAVDAGEHGVLLVAAPVGAGHGEQLEGLDRARAGNVRSAAEVEKIAAAIQGHGVGVDALDELHLVVLALVAEQGDGVVLLHDGTLEGNVRGDDGAHFLLDSLEVIGREGTGSVEVVIETGVYGRADGDLHAGEELLHGGGHDMRRGMTQQLKPFGVLSRHRGGFQRIGGHFSRNIEQFFRVRGLHAAGKSGLEPFAGKSLLQHLGARSAGGGLNQLSFYGYLHGKLQKNPDVKQKKKGRRCLPFRCVFVVGTSRLELLTPSVSRKCSAT